MMNIGRNRMVTLSITAVAPSFWLVLEIFYRVAGEDDNCVASELSSARHLSNSAELICSGEVFDPRHGLFGTWDFSKCRCGRRAGEFGIMVPAKSLVWDGHYFRGLFIMELLWGIIQVRAGTLFSLSEVICFAPSLFPPWQNLLVEAGG